MVMKSFFIRAFIAQMLVLTVVSCRKYSSSSTTAYPTERKIRFQLYTNEDFSGETSAINFSIFIRTANKTLFDSTLAPMQLKDIPDALHKLVIEKNVLANANSDLAAGFQYELENVGISWFIDTSKGGNPFKVIDYAFQ